jgi:hypothetical protein
MEMEQRIENTLNWLFERYLENPTAAWNIATCNLNFSDNFIQEVYELGRFLTRKGFVKNAEFLEDGFNCTITMLGIKKVSNVLEEIKYKVLEGSIDGNKRSIMEILELEQEQFRIGLDYATYLKRIGIIECIFHRDDVFAEPTFYGKEWYEENRGKAVN